MLHGLFGSSANWVPQARILAREWQVIIPDLRNHGRSPWADEMSLDVMADDLRALLDDRGLPAATIIGHSLGGRVAMHFALLHPERTTRLGVLDIAPVDYPNRFERMTADLLRIDPSACTTRDELEAALADVLPDPSERQLIMMGVARHGNSFVWRINLPAIRRAAPALMRFTAPPGAIYGGPTLFLRGGNSNYVKDEYRPVIRDLFPDARFAAVQNAGHWLHAEQPEAFLHALQGWIRTT